jgi:ribosomal protein L37AE/L43A
VPHRPTARRRVTWEVQLPESSLTYSPSPSDINVEIPPRCPTCKTKLQEKKGLIGYKWSCINCNFKVNNQDSYYETSKKVKIFIERDIEKKLEEERT